MSASTTATTTSQRCRHVANSESRRHQARQARCHLACIVRPTRTRRAILPTKTAATTTSQRRGVGIKLDKRGVISRASSERPYSPQRQLREPYRPSHKDSRNDNVAKACRHQASTSAVSSRVHRPSGAHSKSHTPHKDSRNDNVAKASHQPRRIRCCLHVLRSLLSRNIAVMSVDWFRTAKIQLFLRFGSQQGMSVSGIAPQHRPPSAAGKYGSAVKTSCRESTQSCTHTAKRSQTTKNDTSSDFGLRKDVGKIVRPSLSFRCAAPPLQGRKLLQRSPAAALLHHPRPRKSLQTVFHTISRSSTNEQNLI